MVKKQPISTKKNNKSSSLITFMLFWQTSRDVSKFIDAYLFKHANLSTTHLIVLHSIEHNNGSMRPAEIARWTNTLRHNVTTLIQRMEKDGLIRIERVKDKRKNVNVFITDRGRSVLKNAIPVGQEAVDKVMSSFSDDDIAVLHRALIVIRKNVNEDYDENSSHY